MILVKARILAYVRKENVNKQGTVSSEEMLVSEKQSNMPRCFQHCPRKKTRVWQM